MSAGEDSPAIGEMMEIAPGRRLHVVCEGPSAAPPVLFDAGAFGIYADGWWLKEALNTDFRICLYDRAGLGHSDPAPAGVAPSPDFHVEDMRRLRAVLGWQGPHIHVGHSMAGLRMAAYAALYPDDLAGLVFVDALSPAQFAREGGRFLWSQFGWLMRGAAFGAGKGLASPIAQYFPNNFRLSGAPRDDKVRSYGSDRHIAATRDEVQAIDAQADYFRRNEVTRLPLAIFASTPINGMTRRDADLARANTGFGRYTQLPHDDHVSPLVGEQARTIADTVRDIHAHITGKAG